MIVSNDTIMEKPPFRITHNSNKLTFDIGVILGRYLGLNKPVPDPKLRKKNLVRTIHGSTAIEGNTLAMEQVTAILDGRRVLGEKKDILEIQNAIKIYRDIQSYKPHLQNSFLSAHKTLMNGLISRNGKWRNKAVGIIKGSRVKHLAPPAKRVPFLMSNLFSFIKKETKYLNPMILSSVFHYEAQFIHPFLDGNGRMGRFWQTLILAKWNQVFQYIPIEDLVRENQKKYYQVLEICDKEGESTQFIEFMLTIIKSEAESFINDVRVPKQSTKERLIIAIEQFGLKKFSRKDYMLLFKSISTATASRDLAMGIKLKLLSKTGDKAQSVYKKREES